MSSPYEWPEAFNRVKLKYVPEQHRMWLSGARHVVNPAGRRSGKTYLWKRKFVLRMWADREFMGNHYIAGAPVHHQAKRIFWRDFKDIIPKWMISDISNGELYIKLKNDTHLLVAGMDAPSRFEGIRVKGVLLDEFGNMKQSVWSENIRPMLAETHGWSAKIGVPEGRNHYFKMYERAQTKRFRDRGWGVFHWKSSEVLPAEEIEAAKEDLDPLTFRQEFEADFVEFTGRAYYQFQRETHAVDALKYNPALPLILCFDFNESPGVCAYLQEQTHDDKGVKVRSPFTAVIGETWIKQDSKTTKVCERILRDFHPQHGKIGRHQGFVYCYGDSTGGAGGSAKIEGSDWTLVGKTLRPIFGKKLVFKYPRSNPNERPRINAVNSRLMSTTGRIGLLVDPNNAPHVCDDFEGVRTKDDGSGELDKKKDPMLTHISDAIGYYVAEKFPAREAGAGAVPLI